MRLSSLIKDKNVVNGLPSAAYTDEKFLDLEANTVFAENWAFVGFVHELVKPGDIYPVILAGKPIILVRNIKDEIVAFHNVCRHRCLKLVDEPKNTGKLIRCPYHSWTYDLDGKLISSPHFGGTDNHEPKGFDPKKYGLETIRIKLWHDWIFVNLNKKAPPFEKYIKKISKQLKGIDLNKIKPVATLNFGEVATNWKFLVENYVEPYHVQFVHKTTTSQPLKDHYTIVDGNCFGSGVDLNEENTSSANLAVSSRYLSLFPKFYYWNLLP